MHEGEGVSFNENRRRIRFDEALREHFGEFGPFTRRVVALVCLEEMFFTFQVLVSVFLVSIPEFRCMPPGVELLVNCTRSQLDNFTVPWMDFENSLKPDPCHQYERTYTRNMSAACSRDDWFVENTTIAPCRSWQYDSEGETVVTEWDCVCSRAWMASTVLSVFLAGRALGNVVFGWLADRYGRKKVILGGGIANLVAGASAAAAPNYLFFLIMRFLQGAFASGKSTIGFVCAVEFSGPSWWVFSSVMYNFAWSTGYVTLGGIAYILRFHSWRILLISLLAAETIYYPLVYVFMPESPRWLYLHEQMEEADKVIKKIAKVNKKELPEDVCVWEEKDISTRTPFDLIRTPRIRVLTFCLAYIWGALMFVYYGLALNIGSLSGNKYVNFFISGVVDIPAFVLVLLVCNRMGRILPFALTPILGGLSLLLIALVPEGFDWVVVTLAMISKFFVMASVSMLFIYSTEVYPTCIRNIGLTLTAVTGRLTSPIAPFIALLGDAHKAIPYIIFGLSALIAGVLVLLLPETKGVPMPQTIQDGENLIQENTIKLKFWKKRPTTRFKQARVTNDISI